MFTRWIDRNFIKSRSEPWTATPSEEQMLRMFSRLHPQAVSSSSEAIFNLSRTNKKTSKTKLEVQSILSSS